ncbi:hypothetical protein [Sorangium cellulosum]|uniref:Secreted protein n=1 Tax=Sorangium cellulosum TaxID=56 RepID=A0A150QFX7_SORCE|nr:hypothetical protein [Sorangium cellulosum]KYF66813.1 hypothetical protein BE15_47755 [Sorangium cellulosum]
MKRFVQLALFALCVAFSASAAYNVFSDNAAVERTAALVACGEDAAAGAPEGRRASDGCRAQMTRLERTPFGQTFEFTTAKRTVDVRCERAFVLAGEYRCKLR